MDFFDILERRIHEVDSLLCIGLDPHVSQLNEPSSTAAIVFCKEIIEASHPYAAAFKPNIAFFEAFGEDGINALHTVMKSIPPSIPVILDCKRGDIDTTAQAYAQASYDIHNASAVTLSPYMGWDSIKPFVTGKYFTKGAFVLCKTSNPSSKELQDLKLSDGKTIFEQVAKLSTKWNSECGKPCIGLVVGATDLTALAAVRKVVPTSWILCPGVGAQGGDAQSVCNVGLREDGSGILVSVSRGISSVVNKSEAACKLRDEINQCRKIFLQSKSIISSEFVLAEYQKEFIEFALSKNVLQFGEFTLKSGRISPYFFNAGLFDNGISMSLLGKYYAQAIKAANIEFDVIFGPAYKGIPLATAVAISWYHLYGESKDMSYNRKEAKDHGEGGSLVGAKMSGRRVLVVDDVITAGTAIRESVDVLNHVEAILVGVVVSLDRQEKVSETATESAIQSVERSLNVPVVSIVKLKNLVSYVEQSAASNHSQLLGYLSAIQKYRQSYGVDY